MFDELINNIQHINSIINGMVWGIPMLCLIVGVGIFYLFRLKAFQFTHAKDVYKNTIKGILHYKNDKKNLKEKKNVLSQFQALSTALASTIGTGNIAGVSTAIVIGGPGAVFWMWICAFLGMGTHYAEVVLGIYYRNYDKQKGFSGGPMYYLEKGVGGKKYCKHLGKILPILFALFTFLASYGIGNMTQANSISDAISSNFGVNKIIVGVVIAIIAGLIIFGGIKRIGNVAEKLVPFMALFYIIVGLIIVILNIEKIPFVFASIFKGAFSIVSIQGGVFGYVFNKAITLGFKRGAFSNEAGLGSSVIAHSASNEEEPVKQGLWGIFEVFFDTIIVCTFTALIVLSSSLNATSLDDVLGDLTIEEKIVCIDDELKNENGDVLLVDNNFYMMPINVDVNGNAFLYEKRPIDDKKYLEILAYGKKYYLEELTENDATEDSYFFGNVLKINAVPSLNDKNEIIYDENGDIVLNSIHIENINGVSLVTLAVSNKLSHIAGKLLAIAVTLFAFTTILGWSYYGSKTVEYLFGNVATYIYKLFYIIFIVVGATMSLNLAWSISDTLNGFMAIPNLIGVLMLSNVVVEITKNYYAREKGENIKEMQSFNKQYESKK